MFSRIRLHYIFTFAFYLILIHASINAWKTYMEEPTAFQETIAKNQTKLPSFTICPLKNDDPLNKSIQSFDDIHSAIESTKLQYRIKITEDKPYEQPNIIREVFNDTSDGDWYFVPRILSEKPYEIVICLIWTPSINHRPEPDRSVTVCI